MILIKFSMLIFVAIVALLGVLYGFAYIQETSEERIREHATKNGWRDVNVTYMEGFLIFRVAYTNEQGKRYVVRAQLIPFVTPLHFGTPYRVKERPQEDETTGQAWFSDSISYRGKPRQVPASAMSTKDKMIDYLINENMELKAQVESLEQELAQLRSSDT